MRTPLSELPSLPPSPPAAFYRSISALCTQVRPCPVCNLPFKSLAREASCNSRVHRTLSKLSIVYEYAILGLLYFSFQKGGRDDAPGVKNGVRFPSNEIEDPEKGRGRAAAPPVPFGERIPAPGLAPSSSPRDWRAGTGQGAAPAHERRA